jgi:deoxyribose-phosphate aldolase
MNKKTLAQYLDLANHHPEATPKDIEALCQKVKKHKLHAAFVNPGYISLARELMADGLVGTVISFPLGQETLNVKTLAVIDAAKKGADELDVSMNVGLFKGGKEEEVLAEMEAVLNAAKNIKGNIVVKFIIETSLLTEEEIKKASELVFQSGADFVKTNSGWGKRGASLKDVELIREAVGGKIKIKVAGGIHTYEKAVTFIEKGADRIGSSKAVEIVKGAKK